MGHMAGRVCLLQTLPHSHTIQAFIQFSLTFHHYLVFNILPKIPLWWLACAEVFVEMWIIQLSSYKVFLKQIEDHLILGHLAETFSIPAPFLSVHVTQFSSFQSETHLQAVRLHWIHLPLLHLEPSCFKSRTHGHLTWCTTKACFLTVWRGWGR